jgi:YggT family protein
LRLTVYIMIGAIILQAVFSWINPYSPVAPTGQSTGPPLLDPIRRFVPLISGIDLSPLVAILLLQVVLMFRCEADGMRRFTW